MTLPKTKPKKREKARKYYCPNCKKFEYIHGVCSSCSSVFKEPLEDITDIWIETQREPEGFRAMFFEGGEVYANTLDMFLDAIRDRLERRK